MFNYLIDSAVWVCYQIIVITLFLIHKSNPGFNRFSQQECRDSDEI